MGGLIITTLWLGFVLAISFMESWLKFRAKGVTLEVGLSIGTIVFRALNIVEWVCVLALGFSFLFGQTLQEIDKYMLPAALLLILILQTFFLLPVLNERAALLMAGVKSQPSKAHMYYVICECLKVILLVALIAWLAQ